MSLLRCAFLFVSFSSISWDGTLAQRHFLSCKTPDKHRGTCINIRQCPSLLNLLQKERPIPQNILNFLRQSHCGFEGKNPRVCCPHSTEQNGNNRDVNSFPTTTTIDLSTHPRLKELPEECGRVFENDKITMGEVSNLYEFPWMALLGYTSGRRIDYRCGGTLINRRYILTAAHCITQLKNSSVVMVRLGEYDLDTEDDCLAENHCAPKIQDIGIEEIIPHPNYDKKTVKHDIGLLRLRKNAVYNIAVKPICLPIERKERETTLEGKKVIVTGWGATERGIGSSVLMKVSLPIVPLEKCANIYKPSVKIEEGQMCAGGVNGKDSCEGDSGGPLQFLSSTSQSPTFVQYGIVSLGPLSCGSVGMPGVYTKVGNYMQWILDNIKP